MGRRQSESWKPQILINQERQGFFVDFFEFLVKKRLHAMKSRGCFGEAGLLFERFAVVLSCLDVLPPRFINAAEVEVWKRVRFITWRKERPLKPANTTVSVTLC